MHKFGSIALILKSVVEESITHANLALVTLSGINVVFKLLEPLPVINVLTLHNGILSELLNNINVVNDIKDKGFNLGEQKEITLIVKGSIALQLSLQVLLVVGKFT